MKIDIVEKFNNLILEKIPWFDEVSDEYKPFIAKNKHKCIPRDVLYIKFPPNNTPWILAIWNSATELVASLNNDKTTRCYICFCDTCAKLQHLSIFLTSGLNE